MDEWWSVVSFMVTLAVFLMQKCLIPNYFSLLTTKMDTNVYFLVFTNQHACQARLQQFLQCLCFLLLQEFGVDFKKKKTSFESDIISKTYASYICQFGGTTLWRVGVLTWIGCFQQG